MIKEYNKMVKLKIVGMLVISKLIAYYMQI